MVWGGEDREIKGKEEDVLLVAFCLSWVVKKKKKEKKKSFQASNDQITIRDHKENHKEQGT